MDNSIRDGEKISEKLIKLHNVMGLPPVKKMKGRVWIDEIDSMWSIALNGNKVPVAVKPKDTMGCDLDAFCYAIFYNGWLAGIIDVLGNGLLMNDPEGANTKNLMDAIDKKIIKMEELYE